MGKLVEAQFVATHQQAGDFDAVIQGGRIVQKNGGNVASYFCTPDGRVINAVLGPVEADTLLREAKWAVTKYDSVLRLRASDQETELAKEHIAAARRSRGRESQVHTMLARSPLAGLNRVYRPLFGLLGEAQRARRIESPEIVALEEENSRLADEKEQLRESLPDGNGSLKRRRELAKNERLRGEVRQLRDRKKKIAQNEAAAVNWLRVGIAYLKEDEEAGKARLRLVLTRYPDTKAAEKAAELLDKLTRTDIPD